MQMPDSAALTQLSASRSVHLGVDDPRWGVSPALPCWRCDRGGAEGLIASPARADRTDRARDLAEGFQRAEFLSNMAPSSLIDRREMKRALALLCAQLARKPHALNLETAVDRSFALGKSHES